MGCVTVLVLGISLLVAGLLHFGPPVVQNVLLAFGRRTQNVLSDVRARVTGSEPSPEEQLDTAALGYAGGLLSPAEQDAYLQLYEGICALEESFAVFETSAECIDPAYRALMRDHPEFFWLDGSCSYVYAMLGNVVTVTPGLSTPLADVPAVRAQVEAAADAFLGSLPADASEYDIALKTYEHVIATTTYEVGAPQSQNVTSVLLNQRSVCAGYARTYQYLLQRAGLFCAYVEGRIPSVGEDHAWNLVRIDGQFAYVDPTWGDPTYLGESPHISANGIIYDYLCLTTAELERDDHAFSEAGVWPLCDAPQLDFYRRVGLFFESYDEVTLSEAFWRQVGTGSRVCAFKFATDEDLARVRAELEQGTFLLGDLASVATNYSFTVSDSLRIAKIYW